MNLDAVVTRSCDPWAPNHGATNIHVWHVNDVPMVGTFDLHKSKMLFAAVDDVDGPTTVWVYVPLSCDEFTRLDATPCENVSALYDSIDQLCDGRNVIVAHARDFALSKWSVQPTTEGMYGAASAHLQMVVTTLEQQVSDRLRRHWRDDEDGPADAPEPESNVPDHEVHFQREKLDELEAVGAI
ncbi:hypothetical protein [uncultured Serinicoccus sp.]|uniref:hypothetical protein n=1 Tax=uncultured Serinicoccus sp. TaxID=735514 RepID=UPI00260BF33B|nr:hypothetical protein [uncultured Serinicoccus sp.]